MEFIQELISTIFIVLGGLFIVVAALGILKLPDFYIRMSAITKAGTMGVGLIAIGIAIYFNDLEISLKSFVIITFMLGTAPVAAHIIARAAYKQGIPFWGRNLVDELDVIAKNRDRLEADVANNTSIDDRLELINCYTILPPIQGGSLKKAVLIADNLKEIDAPEGHRALGMLYARDRDFILAEDEYKMAVEASGGQIRYKYELAIFYQNANFYKKALDTYDDILKSNQQETTALLEIGKTAVISGLHLERGKEALRGYIASSPHPSSQELSIAEYYLAMILILQKDKRNARVHLQRAVEHNASNQDAAYQLKKL